MIFDTTLLGDWADKLPPRRFPRSLPMGTLDVALIVLARRTSRGAARLGRIYAQHYLSRLRGQRLIGGGGALVSQLLHQTLRRNIPVWLETPVVELVLQEGRVAGVDCRARGQADCDRGPAGGPSRGRGLRSQRAAAPGLTSRRRSPPVGPRRTPGISVMA